MTDQPVRTNTSGVTFMWTRAIRDHGGSLPPRARLAAMLLASWADPDGSNCYPSLATLGAAMGQSEDTARRAVIDLEQAGWLVRWFRPNRSIVFRFLVPDVVLAEMVRAAVDLPEGALVHVPVQGGCAGEAEGCTCAPPPASVLPDLPTDLPTDLPRPPRRARRASARRRGGSPAGPDDFGPSSDTLGTW